MLGKTHLMAGLTVGAAIGTLTGNPISGMTVAGIAALFPDIDEPNSLIGRKMPILAWPIKLIFGHRTITHTVEFAVAMAFMTAWFPYPQNIYLGFYILAGILSHILLDSLTKGGVAPFAVKPDIHLSGPFRTGSILEYIWIIGFGFLLVYLLH